MNKKNPILHLMKPFILWGLNMTWLNLL